MSKASEAALRSEITTLKTRLTEIEAELDEHEEGACVTDTQLFKARDDARRSLKVKMKYILAKHIVNAEFTIKDSTNEGEKQRALGALGSLTSVLAALEEVVR